MICSFFFFQTRSPPNGNGNENLSFSKTDRWKCLDYLDKPKIVIMTGIAAYLERNNLSP